MWSVESSADLEATPAEVWRLYADPGTWRDWAHSTAGAAADGPLAVGATVMVRPTRGPLQRVRIVSFDLDRRLVSQADLPGARILFHYEIERLATGCRVRHRVAMEGTLSAVYGLFMRRSNQRKLTQETKRLAEVLRAAR